MSKSTKQKPTAQAHGNKFVRVKRRQQISWGDESWVRIVSVDKNGVTLQLHLPKSEQIHITKLAEEVRPQ